MTTNPYDRVKQEALYHSYEHGAGCQSKEENPYEDMMGDPEAAKLSSAWLQGFNSKKRPGRPKTKILVNEVEPAIIEEELSDITISTSGTTSNIINKEANKSLQELEDHVLLKELKRRKQLELDKLLEDNKELLNQINKLKQILEL